MFIIIGLKMKPLLLFFHLLFLIPNIVMGGIVEIYSLNGLDDNRGFCIDIRGHKAKAKVKVKAEVQRK